MDRLASRPMQAYAVMVKREAGYDPGGGDWEYAYVSLASRREASHGRLAECAGCAAAYQAVAARAARVSGWMESLSSDVPMPAAAPRKAVVRPAVWVAVGALAAGLVLAAMFARQPGKAPVKAPVEAVAVPPAAVQEQPVTATAMPAASSVTGPAARVRRRTARAARLLRDRVHHRRPA